MPLRCRVSLLASIAGLAMADHHESEESTGRMNCGAMKNLYRDLECCGNPAQETGFIAVPNPETRMTGTNPCEGQKALTEPGMDNAACFAEGVRQAGEQAGGDVTVGFAGTLESTVTPITDRYHKTTLCPVNVHWHLGAEHRSAGQYDETGLAPGTPDSNAPDHARRLTSDARYGYACQHYDSADTRFTTEYAWQHCLEMNVGETYEVHWPHSSLGACGTPYQYQTPFYDGVFCTATSELLGTLDAQAIASNVGVQAQVFTVVNDEAYFYPDLIRGMIVDGNMGSDVAVYTGSTTGTSRDNAVCSFYTPITWQVDRTCHLISASSFDKMCADMKQQRDDMSGDLHPHGARELVFQNLTANNQANIDR